MSLATLMRPRISFRHEAPWMRLCARAVLTGWLLPMLFALLTAFGAGAQPALAQDVVGQTVIVLDFATPAGTDPLLGRKAADALAVELQRTGEYTVVTRQRLQEVVGQQPGLQPPFNDTAQIRLAQALGATSVFSGEVSAINVVPGQSARTRLVVRQLDAGTGDYINGTQNIESTEQKLTPVANEILIDEAVNKAAFSAVRSLRQTILPAGQVLNTTRDDLELSIGARNGVGLGQKYSVLRDIRNPVRNVTERLKIGEVTVIRVEADQALARVTNGGQVGVKTGDRVRQIFVLSQIPSGFNAESGSTNPVNAPVVRETTRGGITKSKSAKGLFGLLGIAALVGLAGFGGGGGSAPSINLPLETNPTGVNPQPGFTFTPGFNGLAGNLQKESVVGYIIFRGESRLFTADTSNIQAFIPARLGSQEFTDPVIPSGRPVFREVIATGGVVPSTGTLGSGVTVEVNELATLTVSSFNITTDVISFQFEQQPIQIGTPYYYRVGVITAGRVSGQDDDGTSIVNVLPTLSLPSATSTQGVTPLLRPLIIGNIPDPTSGITYDLSNFSVDLNSQTDIDILKNNFNYDLPLNTNVSTGVDIFRIQVSTSPNFPDSSTFTSADTAPTSPDVSGTVTLNFGGIQIPGTRNEDFDNGSTPVYIRALSRRSTDAVEVFRVGNIVTVPASQIRGTPLQSGNLLAASRFLKSRGSDVGISIPGRRGRTLNGAGGQRARVGVGKPR